MEAGKKSLPARDQQPGHFCRRWCAGRCHEQGCFSRGGRLHGYQICTRIFSRKLIFTMQLYPSAKRKKLRTPGKPESQQSNRICLRKMSWNRRCPGNLSTCQPCGMTLCCDSSPNKHASKHALANHQPVVVSAEPGENRTYCYEHRQIKMNVRPGSKPL